ncbi:formimidoylglutamate deiminase [Pseudoroseicyclus tamaricis]|uniref:Formimidoylglutamate deiminase n=1 Tax=Pseudoroseicyclus tamaricis TaxID=2705421 RepID=A0A6B2JPZ5_9RHOB|nr:formimidoylglutamate deiminase [Pseudoroseicyclus tamaricis]NDV00188.1 formimidoylglutamate deiminase [Pseudoroseicyclus tamaricis]
MHVIWAEQALLADGWATDVRIDVDDGRITAVTPGAPPDGERTGLVVPAPSNAHSHAFQRAMAGLTERRGPSAQDSFWTWRQLMFRFLEEITPEQVQAIAAFVQMEMAEAGFGTSVEFHYLHHAPGGAPYADLAEMSGRIAAAAEVSGLGLTLLPVAYQFGGLDRRPLGAGQVRFGNDAGRFARLHEGARASLASLPGDTRLGVALHSLRAVAAEDLLPLAGLGDGPIHMHLAEQVAEVEEVQAALGARPAAWAVEHLPLDARWCLIHCTQMEPEETATLARTGAVAGLCPLTEASLGDGIFDGVRWLGTGGAIAIGSDSNIRISLAEELRQLDTSQRLRDRSRAALATAGRSTGRRLMEDAAVGGAQAAGRGSGRIAVGEWADLLALDAGHVDLTGLEGDAALDSFVFAGGTGMVDRVWSAGRALVTGGRHVRREEIVERYRAAVAGLRREI